MAVPFAALYRSVFHLPRTISGIYTTPYAPKKVLSFKCVLFSRAQVSEKNTRERHRQLASFLFLETIQQTIDALLNRVCLQGHQVGDFLSPKTGIGTEGPKIKVKKEPGIFVVNDTLEEQVKKEADEETRLDFLRTFGLEEREIIWPGLPLVSEMMDEPADEHPILIAVFLRVNGSYAISQRLKAASEVSRNGIGSLHLSDIIYVKLDQFMQRHLPIAKVCKGCLFNTLFFFSC